MIARVLLSTLLCIELALLGGCKPSKSPPLLEQIRQRGLLIVGVNYDSPPFGALRTEENTHTKKSSNAQNELVEGFDIDLSREIAQRLLGSPINGQAPIAFRQVVTATRVVAVNSGAVDMVAATMTRLPEREKLVDFSEPYITVHETLTVPANSRVRRLDDLGGQPIAYLKGSRIQNALQKRLPTAQLKGYALVPDAFTALQRGDVAAMADDDILLAGMLTGTCDYRILEESLSTGSYALAFRQDHHGTSKSLRLRVNEILRQMQQDGTLAHIQRKWIQPSPNERCRFHEI